jgi:hypothetical protein
MSRARTPERYPSASGPWIRYLKSGDVSKMPALLRTAKYSNFSAAWYLIAARWPDQCSQSPVSFRALVRS